MHVCVYIAYVLVCVHVHMCMYMNMWACINVCVRMCMYEYMCVCASACMFVCIKGSGTKSDSGIVLTQNDVFIRRAGEYGTSGGVSLELIPSWPQKWARQPPWKTHTTCRV